MKNIFEQGDFNRYKEQLRMEHAMESFTESFAKAQYSDKTTVFISHKHDDLEDLRGIIGFLEGKYNVKCYIDGDDPYMPKRTSGKTAKILKDKITKCNKFILLATDGAVESKWCNWELGFGDAKRFPDNIALFPMKKRGESDSSYKGNEYMSIYPHVVRCSSGDRYSDGELIDPGFYICTVSENDESIITPLGEWLKR